MPKTKNKKGVYTKVVNGVEFTIDPNMPSYKDDPYFVQKAEKAKALIDRVGMPEEYYKKHKS